MDGDDTPRLADASEADQVGRLLHDFNTEFETPSPGADVGAQIMEAVREVTHIEGSKGKTPLSLGIRNDSIELQVKMRSKDDGEKVTIKFPE